MKRKLKKLLSVMLSMALMIGVTSELRFTAHAADPYASIKNTTTVVSFDDKDWYLIDYDSSTVTLLSKECVGVSKFGSNYTYSGSDVETYVNNWYTNNITAKAAVKGGMRLLTIDEAESLDFEVKKCSTPTGAQAQRWWTSTPYQINQGAYQVRSVFCQTGGTTGGTNATVTAGVRPALQLNLSKVTFDPDTKTFTFIPQYPTAKTDLVYSGAEQDLVENPEGTTYLYSLTGDSDFSATIPKGKDAGEYTVYYKSDEGDEAQSLTVTIASREVTVAGIAAKDKVYDGETTAELDFSGVTYKDGDETPLVSGDELTVNATGVFDDANVGEGKNVTISDITLGGASADNYKLADSGNQESTTGIITVRPVTVTAKPQTVELNGTITHGTDKAELTDAVTGHYLEGITLTSSSTVNATTSGTITPSAAVIKAGDADVTSNYSITYANGVLTVNKGTPVVTPPTANTLTYTGEAQELVNAGTTTGGTLVYGLEEDGTYSVEIPKETNVGTYHIWYKVQGDDNYTDYNPENSVEVKISPVNKQTLASAITEAESFWNSIKDDNKYSEIATELQNAIDAAKEIYSNDNVTSGEVSTAVTNLNAAKTKAEQDKLVADYNAEKVRQIINADNQSRDNDSANCQSLIADAKAAIDSLEYDDSKSYEENVQVITAIVNKLINDLAEQREIDSIEGAGTEANPFIINSYDDLTVYAKYDSLVNPNSGEPTYVQIADDFTIEDTVYLNKDTYIKGEKTVTLTNRKYFGISDSSSAALTIDGPVFGNSIDNPISGSPSGSITLISGTVGAIEGTGSLEVSGGVVDLVICYADTKISGGTVGAVFITGMHGSSSNVEITGGTFEGFNNTSIEYNEGTLVIKGGKYRVNATDKDVLDDHVIEGYEAVEEGEYYVIKKSPTVTAPVVKSDLQYTGEPQKLVEAGSTTGGTLVYSLDENGTYTEDIPERTEVGTYYVWYKVLGNDEYAGTTAQVVETQISAVDKTDLENVINSAKDVYDQIKDDDRFTTNAEALSNAIQQAETVKNNNNVTLSQVEEAIEAVNAAKNDAVDTIAAKSVEEKINNLPPADSITKDNKDEIKTSAVAAREAYNGLTDNGKIKVDADTLSKLSAVEEAIEKIEAAEQKEADDTAAANAVKAQINALPAADAVTIDNKDAINAARTAYDNLTADQKAKIDEATLQKLTNAEAALAVIEQDIADQAAANVVKGKIDALPDSVSSDNQTSIDAARTQIEAARAAYEALTDAQKGKIDQTTLDKLTQAEAALASAQDTYDSNKAQVVIDKINNLPAADGVTVNDQGVIEAAREAYNALTESQKGKVPSETLQHLADAETALAAAKAAAEKEEADNAAAQAVKDRINSLPDPASITTEDKDAINNARNAYNNLTDDQKALVDEETIDKLAAAEEALANAEAAAQKEKTDNEAADAVRNQINALPAAENIVKSNKDAIEAARAAYNALTDEQKAKISEETLKRLTDAETALANIKEATYSKYVDKIGSAPETYINNDVYALANVLLTEEERARVNSGEDIAIFLSVEDVSSKIAQEVKDSITAVLASGQKIGTFLDINLYKKIGTSEQIAIHDAVGKVSIGVQIPDSLINTDSNIERSYGIVRYHNGQSEIIASTTDLGKKLITFESDKFSIYAIVYTDKTINSTTPGNNTNNTPAPGTPSATPTNNNTSSNSGDSYKNSTNVKTGDDLNYIYVILMMLSACGCGYLIIRRRKSE